MQEQTLPLIDPLQAMQRQVIGMFADDQVSQEARPRQSLGDRHGRLGRDDYHLTGVQELARGHRRWGPWMLLRGLLAGRLLS